MSKKKALGGGLDALLGDEIDISGDSGGPGGEPVRRLPIDAVKPNPQQPRKKINPETLSELAESIRKQGVIQPLLVEERADGGYMIVAGERRWRACREAGLSEVPVIVRRFTPEQKLEIALVENIQREDLTPMEEARAYHHLIEALGLSQQDAAERVGKKRSTVANSLRLLKLPETMRAAVDGGRLSAGHARALLSVVSPADQELLFSKITAESLSVRDAENAAASMNRGDKPGAVSGASGPGGVSRPGRASGVPRSEDAEMRDLEERFIAALGTRVNLRGDFSKGRIEISWFSRDDLDRIYRLIIADR